MKGFQIRLGITCAVLLVVIVLLSVFTIHAEETDYSYTPNWAPELCQCDSPPDGIACGWSPHNIAGKHRHFMVSVNRVVDGDTIDVSVYLGLGVWKDERLRLWNIDAWEVRGAEREKGLIAKKFVYDWVQELGPERYAILETNQKRGKYGRLLADLIECGHYLTEDLLKNGHAVKVKY